jgi:hypothetical protein
MSDVDIKTETEQMRQIESYLSNYDRKVVENNPEKGNYVNKMNVLNSTFIDVLDITCQFRFELGITL